MAILHDSSVRSSLEARLHTLKPGAKPRWDEAHHFTQFGV